MPMNGAGHVSKYIRGNQIVHALNPSQDVLTQNMDYEFGYMPIHSFRTLDH